MTLTIDFTDQATSLHHDAILKPLRVFNDTVIGSPEAATVAWTLRDPASDEIVGGLYARLGGRWLFVELLVVPERMRGQGTGRELMAQAEALAREKGCCGIWLDTFSFQAPDFYRKLGFEVFGELADFPPGHTRYFLRKRLASHL
ncbi:GNAT family N-acetyltransferase [Pseudomonas mosselii]|uniref:GNAT family N-acetyltransferase n=1 Tax=Pseudomonas mosselii TaxID=78327 RepID=UPI0007702583|nr:GNAT family N-acetyltransferase [Pseudomonas mosselii]AMK30841.1 Acetyltransferase [Pseudomonas putida]MBC3451755.1 GNAT family N-acetyltransferase [Pseudomonas mosselii]